VAGRNREVDVALTPVGQGRFEVYLNGEQVYNRKEPPDDMENPAGDIRTNVSLSERWRTKLLSALEAATPTEAAAH
jgi:Rdx family protein